MWPVVWVALGVVTARVIYLALVCRYELVEDEAQYWLWAQRPGWSYYSKGPGVAWAIWLSTHLFGDAEWAVRLPSALMSGVGVLAAGLLGWEGARWARERGGDRAGRATPVAAGVGAAVAFALAPALQMAGVLMTIDGPYVACWALAAWGAWRALVRREGWGWAVMGACVGVGFLFKYTMLLVVPGVVVFAWWRKHADGRGHQPPPPARRASPPPPGGEDLRGGRAWMWLGVALAVLGLVPVVVWNAGHGWVTVRHLLGHLGVRGGDVDVGEGAEGGRWSALWMPELVVQQVVMVGPWVVLGVTAGWRAVRGRGEDGAGTREGRAFLALCAAPIMLFYLAVSLIAEPEGNWPMAAYATLMPLAGWAGADAVAAGRRGGARRAWRWGLGYALAAGVLVHGLNWIGDGMLALNRVGWVHGAFVRATGREPRDPVGRIRGGGARAEHVHELARGLLERTGQTPFVLAQHYGTASQLAYALRGARVGGWAPDIREPSGVDRQKKVSAGLEVLCAMAFTGGRKSQFDLWPETSLFREDLKGRPAVIVSPAWALPYWERMFERVEPIPGERLRGEHKPDRSAYLGFGWIGPGGTGGAGGAGGREEQGGSR